MGTVSQLQPIPSSPKSSGDALKDAINTLKQRRKEILKELVEHKDTAVRHNILFKQKTKELAQIDEKLKILTL